MISNTQKILGINTDFDSLNYKGFVENSFRHATSFMDYDAVIIDTSYLGNKYGEDYTGTFQGKRKISSDESFRMIEDYKRIKTQIIDFLQQGKNIFVLMGTNNNCFVHTGQTEYNGTGKNARATNLLSEFNAFCFLPIDINPTMVSGEQFDITCQPPYSSFFQKIKDIVHYAAYFEVPKNNRLLTLPNSEKTISACFEYEKGKIIILPYPYDEDCFETDEEWRKAGKKFLNAIFELNNTLNSSADSYVLPIWANDIKILDEEAEESNLEKDIKKLYDMEKKIEMRKELIKKIKNKKILFTASGTALEELVKETLQEIGFTMCSTEVGRSDIIAMYEDIDIVAEIKGVSKSAAERHSAQLEKWVSEFVIEKENVPKAILIVNGYCDTPLTERTEEVFPEQMLKFCESREHALVTTTQLLCMYIEIKQNPSCTTERIRELLSCVGRYQRYQNYEDYLTILKKED